jgi:hypothetical protein
VTFVFNFFDELRRRVPVAKRHEGRAAVSSETSWPESARRVGFSSCGRARHLVSSKPGYLTRFDVC